MSNYRQLDEDIVIDIEQNNPSKEKEKDFSIFLRNTKNETIKISINKLNTKLIKELKSEVNIK